MFTGSVSGVVVPLPAPLKTYRSAGSGGPYAPWPMASVLELKRASAFGEFRPDSRTRTWPRLVPSAAAGAAEIRKVAPMNRPTENKVNHRRRITSRSTAGASPEVETSVVRWYLARRAATALRCHVSTFIASSGASPRQGTPWPRHRQIGLACDTPLARMLAEQPGDILDRQVD